MPALCPLVRRKRVILNYNAVSARRRSVRGTSSTHFVSGSRARDFMRNVILVTGGAGFIGSNFILRELAGAGASDSGASIVNLDKLTYAGNVRDLCRGRCT